MKIFAFFGHSNTGKTQLISKIARKLTEDGYKVGYLKLTRHKGPFDAEGKDTFRLHENGAITIGLLHPEGSVVWKYGRVEDESDFIRRHFVGVQYLFIEGRTCLAVPKIKCVEEEKEMEDDPLIIGYCSLKVRGFLNPERDFNRIYNMVLEKSMPLLPHIDCGECGYPTCKEFAIEYLKNGVKLKDCKILSENAVIVRVGGKRIEIKSFVQEFIGNMILGALSSLKGFDTSGQIDIKINPDAILSLKEEVKHEK